MSSIEERSLNIRHNVRGQRRQLDGGTIDHGNSTMNGIELVDLRVQVIVFEPGHAGRGEIGDDDASVRGEVDGLGRVEAVVGALLEGGEVLPLFGLVAGQGDHCGWFLQ